MFLLRITAGVLIAATVLLCSVKSDDLIETQAGFSNSDEQPEQQRQNQHQDQDQELAGERNLASNKVEERNHKFDIVSRIFADMKQELDEKDAKFHEKDAKIHELSSRFREAEDRIASLEANCHGEGVRVTVPEPDNIKRAWIETNYGKIESSSDGDSFVEATKRVNSTLARQREIFKRVFNYLIIRFVAGGDQETRNYGFLRGHLDRVKELAARINQYDQWIASKFKENVDNIVALKAQGGDHFVEATKKARDDFFRYRAGMIKEFDHMIAQMKGSGLKANHMMNLGWIHTFTKVFGELALEDFKEAVRNVVGLQNLQKAEQTSS